MDEIDLQILQTLQKDGRTPFTTIAKQTKVSESTIRSRYTALVKQGVVNTVSIVDPFALGIQAPAIIAISVEPGKTDQVAKEIIKFPEVSYQVMVLGTYDLIIEVYCRDLAHLTDFIYNHLQHISGIRDTETFMVSKMYKLSYRWSPDFEQLDSD